jgi:acyl-coenzyme A synthetase/AMP-(fatty) acid ligase/acyl carrier protein
MLLLFGHTVHMMSEELRQDPRALLAYVEKHSLDVLDLTPAQLRLLIDEGLLKTREYPSLVLVGGEPIDERLWQHLAKHPTIDFYNVYGPTECTINSTVCRIREAPSGPTIGRPLSNVQVYILDEWQKPVPVGVAGELYVGGEGLARGYLFRPGLTATKFIANPFSRKPGSRLYCTSDLARFKRDGSIEFLGRTDSQVKLRGYRIELGEIEAALKEHPALGEALVTVREDAAGGKNLVGYLVARESPAPSINELKDFLRLRLPAYMVPATFVLLEEMPLTTTGKIDVKALPVPEHVFDEASYLAPRTPIEAQVAAIWSEILGVEHVGVTDNFFELGGHSLLATRVISRIRDVFQLEVPVRGIFETPTVAGLAEIIVQMVAERTGSEEMSTILTELQHLSEDEAQTMLANKT